MLAVLFALAATSTLAPAAACVDTPTSSSNAATVPQGDPKARAAAQRGLDFLAKAAVQWQDRNKCYGCHVQAVTMEAMTVGKSHQFSVNSEQLDSMVWGMTEISGGAHGKFGLTVGESSYLPETSKTFGGAAFAHYDERVGPKLRHELEATATALLDAQDKDGSVRQSYDNLPIAAGRVQATAQALITWRQVHARTADTRWLVPIRRADAWLTLQGKQMSDGGDDLQDLDHAIMGLHAAGAGAGDKLIAALARVVLRMQHQDGGFGFHAADASNAFATGQATYVLRLAGRSDADHAVVRATAWLLNHQEASGGWGGAGFAKAEAMWAVLGLVSMDMISVDLVGLIDGQRVLDANTVKVSAADNTGASVKTIELLVDDLTVASACGATLSANIDGTKLSTGPHLVDVVATGSSGKQSRRRIIVYAGDAFVQDLGARFDVDHTVLGFRSLAPDSMKSKIRIVILDDIKREVAKVEFASVEGPMSWTYAGKSGGRFTALVSLVDASGTARGTQQTIFTHDTYEAQTENFAEVAGQVQIDGDDAAANTEVELVDKDGTVVQRATTTRSGQYRFSNVDDGKYKVRVNKRGFKTWEADLSAPKAAQAAAPAASLERQ